MRGAIGSALTLLVFTFVAHASESVALEELLKQAQKSGTRLIYSSALVSPEMRVAGRGTTTDALSTLLAPHGLELRPGPAGAWVVVKAPAANVRPGVVSFVKVLSDKVEDVSSIDALLKSIIKPGMSDAEKAMAIWRTVVKFRHQDSPPWEFLQESGSVHDAIKTFNVYGYGMCSCASANFLQLARAAGLKARGWAIQAHSVPEVFYDGAWHLMDPSLINYFPKADGTLAGVEEIGAGVDEWRKDHPKLLANDELNRFMRGGNWRKNGPEILSRCPTLDDNGWYPAATHGWYSAIHEYANKAEHFVYEYGYSEGYQANIQLREGERITRNWSNKGLHVNMDWGGAPGVLSATVGQNDLRYSPANGDLAPGRIGNGTHEYDVPLASGAFRGGAMLCENLACRAEDLKSPALHVKDANADGVFIMRMPSAYVYLGGELLMRAIVGEGGEVSVHFSDNNGLSWKQVSKLNASGDQKIDLKSLVFRRYDYRLKFVLRGKGTGIDALKLTHDIQHSQRALPALDAGENKIAFSAGPAESTVTLEGHFNPEWKSRNVFYMDYQPDVKNFAGFPMAVQHGSGEITFPISTPGDMLRIRCGAHYRVRDPRDTIDLKVSFDEGKNWKTLGRMPGPAVGHSHWFTLTDIPAGTRAARIKYEMQQRNTTCIFGFRIDADYREAQGGFRPVKVSYEWTENGVEKRDERIVKSANATYTINCASKPLMKSIRLELAD
ncbi:MAG TPA: hypothetical protein VEJ63_21025 [Planctomycetota bacterium]|nr:hypothetical protein [Planctomycetota bacterium]